MRYCPNCNNSVSSLNCHICGYDFENGTYAVNKADLSGWNKSLIELDIWVGHFEREKDFDAYFEEADVYVDDEPISLFAKEQGMSFYDHDFFVSKYLLDKEDIKDFLASLMVCDANYEMIVKSCKSKVKQINVVAAQLGELSNNKGFRVAKGNGYQLVYVGRFAYLPRQS